MAPRTPTKPEERPVERFRTTVALGRCVGDLRRGMDIRQAELAARAKVSRQWLTGLEQGKPTLEIALVLRTLETLGLELLVRPMDPVPEWIARTRREAVFRRERARLRHNEIRRNKSEQNRARRLLENYPTVRPDLE